MVNKREGNITRVSNNNSPQAGNNLAASRQAGTHLPSGEGSNTPLASPLLPPQGRRWSKGSQEGLGTHLPPGEGSNSSPQATAHLPPREGSTISQAIAHLPPREGSNSPPATAHLPPSEGSSSSEATAHLPPREGSSNSQAGQAGSQARSGRQGSRHSTRHRAPQASQGNSAASQADSTNSWESIPTPTIPNRLPQGSSNEEPNPKWVIKLSSKPLTPAQRSVLAKGLNFAVSPKQPPNLEYIITIEAACTKLSQQDAEELRADINRVLRSSHPPNPA